MSTQGSLLPGAQAPVASGDGRIGPPWYRFFARLERLLGKGLTDAGTGLAINGQGALTIADNGVSNEMLRDSLALSVIGRTLDSDGDPQDIQAAANGWFLQRDADQLVFRLPRLPSYTVATVPNATGVGAASLIFVSNESGGATVAFSDGSAWRRVQDRAVIS